MSENCIYLIKVWLRLPFCLVADALDVRFAVINQSMSIKSLLDLFHNHSYHHYCVRRSKFSHLLLNSLIY